ncbi:hypothetical protein J2Y67_005623 [Neobacillus niacini]|nr:hypothetical protein [Neobacillus niacini]
MKGSFDEGLKENPLHLCMGRSQTEPFHRYNDNRISRFIAQYGKCALQELN